MKNFYYSFFTRRPFQSILILCILVLQSNQNDFEELAETAHQFSKAFSISYQDFLSSNKDNDIPQEEITMNTIYEDQVTKFFLEMEVEQKKIDQSNSNSNSQEKVELNQGINEKQFQQDVFQFFRDLSYNFCTLSENKQNELIDMSINQVSKIDQNNLSTIHIFFLEFLLKLMESFISENNYCMKIYQIEKLFSSLKYPIKYFWKISWLDSGSLYQFRTILFGRQSPRFYEVTQKQLIKSCMKSQLADSVQQYDSFRRLVSNRQELIREQLQCFEKPDRENNIKISQESVNFLNKRIKDQITNEIKSFLNTIFNPKLELKGGKPTSATDEVNQIQKKIDEIMKSLNVNLVFKSLYFYKFFLEQVVLPNNSQKEKKSKKSKPINKEGEKNQFILNLQNNQQMSQFYQNHQIFHENMKIVFRNYYYYKFLKEQDPIDEARMVNAGYNFQEPTDEQMESKENNTFDKMLQKDEQELKSQLNSIKEEKINSEKKEELKVQEKSRQEIKLEDLNQKEEQFSNQENQVQGLKTENTQNQKLNKYNQLLKPDVLFNDFTNFLLEQYKLCFPNSIDQIDHEFDIGQFQYSLKSGKIIDNIEKIKFLINRIFFSKNFTKQTEFLNKIKNILNIPKIPPHLLQQFQFISFELIKQIYSKNSLNFKFSLDLANTVQNLFYYLQNDLNFMIQIIKQFPKEISQIIFQDIKYMKVTFKQNLGQCILEIKNKEEREIEGDKCIQKMLEQKNFRLIKDQKTKEEGYLFKALLAENQMKFIKNYSDIYEKIIEQPNSSGEKKKFYQSSSTQKMFYFFLFQNIFSGQLASKDSQYKNLIKGFFTNKNLFEQFSVYVIAKTDEIKMTDHDSKNDEINLVDLDLQNEQIKLINWDQKKVGEILEQKINKIILKNYKFKIRRLQLHNAFLFKFINNEKIYIDNETRGIAEELLKKGERKINLFQSLLKNRSQASKKGKKTKKNI